MPIDTRVLMAVGIALWMPAPAVAQDIPIPSLLDRGVRGVFGGGDKEREPGAYVSPSAADLVPDAREVGAPSLRSLQRFDPIALPADPGQLRAPSIDLPGLPAYAPQNMPSQDMIRSRATLTLEARLTEDGESIPHGLIWRLFSAIPGLDGRPSLIASSESNIANFEVPTGSYILHVAFGRAGLVRRIDFTGVKTREVVVLDAGGLRLDALVSDGSEIDASKLTFDIYTDAEIESERNLVAGDVPPSKIVRLNAGTYHVVSNYGSINALVRADIRVEAGKVTDATLQHRAALMTMKLVREPGGEALADTAWSVTTASGDIVRQSVGAFPSMVLAEGEYVLIAKNRDKVYQRIFEVQSGHNVDVEVLTSSLSDAPDALIGSGD
ncbi:hypothetical protein [Aurantimonas endophytica]|uniref:Carboxypeptidase family protein n=1 Tax=Aurantimonas endophytica TaxID=1522175 RepID=A0A7W6MN03_9HYPH|nr:hypothetical protein [Aurantimonas endophytica]